MKELTIALPKGRLATLSCRLLEQCGVDCSAVGQGRKLIFHDAREQYRFFLVKPSDVPIYLEYGVADIGIAGKDTLMEENCSLYEMLDLGFGKCRLCIAGFEGALQRTSSARALRVATKYVNTAKRYYAARGETVEIIKLNGSVELGPLVGLADVILDIVESGATLRENGLQVLEEICPISARLVVNRVSLKTKADMIHPLIERMGNILKEELK